MTFQQAQQLIADKYVCPSWDDLVNSGHFNKEGCYKEAAEFYARSKEDDLKSSLRKSIEERIKFVKECMPPDAHYEAMKKGGLYELEKVLQLLDTCTRHRH